MQCPLNRFSMKRVANSETPHNNSFTDHFGPDRSENGAKRTLAVDWISLLSCNMMDMDCFQIVSHSPGSD